MFCFLILYVCHFFCYQRSTTPLALSIRVVSSARTRNHLLLHAALQHTWNGCRSCGLHISADNHSFDPPPRTLPYKLLPNPLHALMSCFVLPYVAWKDADVSSNSMRTLQSCKFSLVCFHHPLKVELQIVVSRALVPLSRPLSSRS